MKKIILGFFLLILSFFSFNLVNAEEIKIYTGFSAESSSCSSAKNCIYHSFYFANVQSPFLGGGLKSNYNASVISGQASVVGVAVDYDNDIVSASSLNSPPNPRIYGSGGFFEFKNYYSHCFDILGTSVCPGYGGYSTPTIKIVKTNNFLFKISGKKIQKYNTSTSTWQDFFTGFDYNIAYFNIVFSKITNKYYLTITTFDSNAKTMYGSNVFSYSIDTSVFPAVTSFDGYDLYYLFPNKDGTIKSFDFTKNDIGIKRVNDYSFPLIAFGYSNMQGNQITYVKNDGHLYLSDFKKFSGLSDYLGGSLVDINDGGDKSNMVCTDVIKENVSYTGTLSFSSGANSYYYNEADTFLFNNTSNSGAVFSLRFKNLDYDFLSSSLVTENYSSGLTLFKGGKLDLTNSYISKSSLLITSDKYFKYLRVNCTPGTQYSLYMPLSQDDLFNGDFPLKYYVGDMQSNYNLFECNKTYNFVSDTSQLGINFKGIGNDIEVFSIDFGDYTVKYDQTNYCTNSKGNILKNGVEITLDDIPEDRRDQILGSLGKGTYRDEINKINYDNELVGQEIYYKDIDLENISFSDMFFCPTIKNVDTFSLGLTKPLYFPNFFSSTFYSAIGERFNPISTNVTDLPFFNINPFVTLNCFYTSVKYIYDDVKTNLIK